MWRAFTLAVEGATLCGNRRDGPGLPLVLLHGMGGARDGWDRVIAHLPPAMPLLRHDLRGFGASAADEATEYSHGDDLLALLDAQGIERAALCGLSMGGAIAAGFALDHPDRVERLVLVSPALAGWEWSAEWRALWREVAAAARSGEMDRARELWWLHPMFAAARESAGAQDLRREIAAFAGRQWVGDRQRPVLPDLDRLHTLAAPTLLLTGGRDFTDFRLIADLLEATVPSLSRIDYPQAGHMLPLEAPRDVARAVAAFMAG